MRLVLTVFAVTLIAFLMVNALPGDVAHIIAGPDAGLEDVEAIRRELGLERNLLARYFIWLANAVRGDLGVSFHTEEPVFDAIVSRLPVSLELLVIAQFIALVLALPAGIVCAYRNNALPDRLIGGVGFATLSIPAFVMAFLGIYLFSIKLRLLPATGYTPFSESAFDNVRSFILPGLSIACVEWVVLMRVLRSDMITTLQENFILMAKAKGLPPWRIILHHALRPSSLTLLTVLGIQTGRCIGEAVIVETIFALPGIGRLLLNAIYARDYLMVQGCILVITIGYVVINCIVDLLYTFLDPRIKTQDIHGQ